MSTHDSTRPSSRLTSRSLRCSIAVLVSLAVVGVSTVAAAQSGAQLFATCAACHTIGGGRRVGPDLAGVTQRRTEQWLISYIRSPGALARSGDAVAAQLLRDFSPIVMPDQALSDAQIRSIIAHMSGGAATSAPEAPTPPGTPADIQRGSELFQGIQRFENRGPACTSCHHVRNDAVIGGGVLARELTRVFTRIGGGGVGAILGSPPFPVMERAYAGRTFNRGEIHALVAFLQNADAQHAFQQPRDYGLLLVLSGGGVFLGLMVLYVLFWNRRRTRSVNDAIYARQVRSV